MRRTCILTVGAVLASLAVSPGAASALTFDEAPGSPVLSSPLQLEGGPFYTLGGIASADFNGDGYADVAVVNASAVPVVDGGESVSVFLGGPSGALTLAPGSPFTAFAGGDGFERVGPIVAGAFTANHDQDLVVGDQESGRLDLFLGDGHGGFTPGVSPPSFPNAGPQTYMTTGDFNGDGELDFAVVNNDITVYLGNGAGGFTQLTPVVLPTGETGSVNAIAAGDFTGDGRTDLAIATSNGIYVYLAAADGSMSVTPQSPIVAGPASTEPPPTNLPPQGIVAGQFTADGHTDLAATYGSQFSSDPDAGPSAGSVTVLHGDGTGAFPSQDWKSYPVPAGAVPSNFGAGTGVITAGRFTDSPNLDLAVANTDNVDVLLGDGQGGFTPAPGGPWGVYGNTSQVIAADVNGDGLQDIITDHPWTGRINALLDTTATGPLQVTGPPDFTFADSQTPPAPLTVTNTGSTPVGLGTISLSGNDPTAFSLSDDDCSGRTLAPNASCAVDVAYVTPPIAFATVVIPSDASTMPLQVGVSGDPSPWWTVTTTTTTTTASTNTTTLGANTTTAAVSTTTTSSGAVTPPIPTPIPPVTMSITTQSSTTDSNTAASSTTDSNTAASSTTASNTTASSTTEGTAATSTTATTTSTPPAVCAVPRPPGRRTVDVATFLRGVRFVRAGHWLSIRFTAVRPGVLTIFFLASRRGAAVDRVRVKLRSCVPYTIALAGEHGSVEFTASWEGMHAETIRRV